MNCFLDARCSMTVIDQQREAHNAISFTELCSISPWDRKMREICCNYWPVHKLSKKIWDDRPKSESDSDIFGDPKFLDSDLHL